MNKQPLHPKALSWPCALGLTTDDTAPGLGIAFGWSALGSLWQAHAQAKQAGMMLAALITQIHALPPQRPIHLMGHSLGARVILTALPHAPSGSVHRLLLLAPAEYQSTTRAALTSPAGRQAEAFMITSGENALFDVGLERLIAPPCPKDRVIGLSAPDLPNLTTLRLDCPQHWQHSPSATCGSPRARKGSAIGLSTCVPAFSTFIAPCCGIHSIPHWRRCACP